MDVESLAKELILKNMTPEQQQAVLDSVKSSVSQAREVQKRKIGENVDLVVQALKKIESDIRTRFDDVGNAIEKRVSSIQDGRDGANGKDGWDGKDGRNGRDGAKGDKGDSGQDGIDGINGVDGVSVSNARIDFDGSLVITLSTGVELNVGEVVAPDLAESIKIITNGGGTSQSVLDTLASLQTQITALIPSQTGNSGKFLTTNGTSTSWASTAGGVSSVASADGSVTVTNTSGAIDLSVAVAASTTNMICQVRNTTGSTLTKGTAVYISGATGQIPTVSKALATSDATSAQTLGLMTADLANNTNGYVTVIGLITNMDTSAYTDGAQLYLSGTTAGTLTATKTYAPTHLVYMAVVEHAHPTQGKLFVKVQNGYELDEIHNVSAQSPSNGQTIVYNTSTSLWEKANITGTASQVTVTNGAGSIALSLPSTINVNTTGSASGGASGAIAATTLSASSTVSGTGFTNYFASPPAIGETAAAAGTFTSLSDSGNLTFTGTGNRITGEMSNATHVNRVAFQTSTVNGATSPFLLPNGSGNTTQWVMASAADPTNSSFMSVGLITAGDARLNSGILGTGTYLPMTFYTGGSERVRIDTSGNIIAGSGEASATPVGNIVRAPNATGTNIAGANLFLYAGNGTGTGGSGYIDFQVAPVGSTGSTANTLASAMRITNNGNVGIGTSTTTYRLNVQSSSGIMAQFNGNNANNYIQLSDNNATNNCSFGSISGGNWYLYTSGYGAFYTGGAEKMRITSAGGISFGATGTAYGTSGQTLISAGNSAPTWGTLGVGAGGTGQTSYTDGQLLIGNTTGNTLTKATLTAGTGISVTNGNGSISIASTGVSAYPASGIAVSTGSAWNTSLTAPSGTIVGTTDTQTLTNKTIQGGAITSATPVASTSGTSIEFKNIPSWVKQITVMLSGVSLSGTSDFLVQLGTGATPTYTTTGYTSSFATFQNAAAVATVASTAGFIFDNTAAASTISGQMIISLLSASAFTYTESSNFYESNGRIICNAGVVSLASILTAVRVIAVNGTDTFDAGNINVIYQG